MTTLESSNEYFEWYYNTIWTFNQHRHYDDLWAMYNMGGEL
jgi:hypothetical protein